MDEDDTDIERRALLRRRQTAKVRASLAAQTISDLRPHCNILSCTEVRPLPVRPSFGSTVAHTACCTVRRFVWTRRRRTPQPCADVADTNLL